MPPSPLSSACMVKMMYLTSTAGGGRGAGVVGVGEGQGSVLGWGQGTDGEGPTSSPLASCPEEARRPALQQLAARAAVPARRRPCRTHRSWSASRRWCLPRPGCASHRQAPHPGRRRHTRTEARCLQRDRQQHHAGAALVSVCSLRDHRGVPEHATAQQGAAWAVRQLPTGQGTVRQERQHSLHQDLSPRL